jgi:hypothetical protein
MVAGRLAQEAKRDACSWSKSGVDRQSDGHQTPVLGQKDKCVGCRGRAARGSVRPYRRTNLVAKLHAPGGYPMNLKTTNQSPT